MEKSNNGELRGWTKKSGGAAYADVSERTFHKWFDMGLRHIRLPLGTVLTRFSWIDAFLQGFEVEAKKDPLDELVNEIMDEMDKN